MKEILVTSHVILNMLRLGQIQEHAPVVDGMELILSVMVNFNYYIYSQYSLLLSQERLGNNMSLQKVKLIQ